MGDWKRYIHPEGLPYFVLRRESIGGSRKIQFFTEANLNNEEVLNDVKEFMGGIEAQMSGWPNIPKNVEVVLEIQDDWTYYMVDLDRRCVFWLDEHDFSGALGEDFGFESRLQFRMNDRLIHL